MADQHDQHPSDPLVVAAAASNEPEAARAGLRHRFDPGLFQQADDHRGLGIAWNPGQQRGIYVLAGDLERALVALGQTEHRSQEAEPDPVPEPKRRFGFLHKDD